MIARVSLFVLLLAPLLALAQDPAQRPGAATPVNAATLAVLLANRPAHLAEEQWLRMMQEPMNRSLHPLRLTPAMLDTLDGRQLDPRFQYVMVPEARTPPVATEVR